MGQIERGWRWCKRNPTLAGLTATLAASLLLGTILTTSFGLRATMNARRADRLAGTARLEATRAEEAALKARDGQEWSARLRYDAEIYAAVMNCEAGRIYLAREQLAELIPKTEEESDFRGFEWYYLNALFNRELRVLKGPESGVFSVAFSPDGADSPLLGARTRQYGFGTRSPGKNWHRCAGMKIASNLLRSALMVVDSLLRATTRPCVCGMPRRGRAFKVVV